VIAGRLIAAVEPIFDPDASAPHAAGKNATHAVAPEGVATARFRRWRWTVLSGIAIATIIVAILITLTRHRELQSKSVVVSAPPLPEPITQPNAM
jgi:hypothetical protein